MESTRLSLLQRARAGEDAGWRQLVALYQPLIRGWLTRYHVHPQEVEDLTQDVLAMLIRELPRFEHAGRPGSFRGWLRQISVNRAREFWRRGKCRAASPGGSEFLEHLAQLEDPESAPSRRWDEEHDRHVLRHLLASLEQKFEPVTLQAFRRLTFDHASGQQVAAELGMTRSAVYNAKARVLEHLREEAEGLLDSTGFGEVAAHRGEE
jgi:RNA polymerase sigma-70 factor (ECF subfamily)